VTPDSTAPVHLFVAVVLTQLVLACQGLEHRQWEPQDNTGHTLMGEDIVRILGVPSFVDRGSIHKRRGSGGIEKEVFGSANTPVATVEEEKAVQSWVPSKAAVGMAQVDNNHTDSHRLEPPEY
jgi:hypothetical protein